MNIIINWRRDVALPLVLAIIAGIIGGYVANTLSDQEIEKKYEQDMLIRLGQLVKQANSYQDVGDFDSAIKIYEDSLKTISEKDQPILYGIIQSSLLFSYTYSSDLKELEWNLNRAISDNKEFLDSNGKDQDYGIRGWIQFCLGESFLALSNMRDKINNLNNSILAYEDASNIFINESNSYMYLKARIGAAGSYVLLSEYINPIEKANKSIGICQEILNLTNIIDYPIEYGITNEILGLSYTSLAYEQDTIENFQKAIEALNESAKIFDIENYPYNYAYLQIYRGNAYLCLAWNQVDTEKNLYKSIEAYQESLRIFNLDKYPIEDALTKRNLGEAYLLLSDVTDREKNLINSIGYCDEALKVCSLEQYPVDYFEIQTIKGQIYLSLSKIIDKNKNINNSLRLFHDSQKIFKKEKYPYNYAYSQELIGNAYELLSETECRKDNLENAQKAYIQALVAYEEQDCAISQEIVNSRLEEVKNEISTLNQ